MTDSDFFVGSCFCCGAITYGQVVCDDCTIWDCEETEETLP
jgi:hypothetical protein